MATIVVATEDSRCGELLAAELEAEGHRVVLAAMGPDAYDAVLAEAPALVLLDGKLPVFSGMETCRMLRDDPAVAVHLPIYLLGDARVDAQAAEKAGLTGYLDKRHETHLLRDLLAAHAIVG